MDQIKERVEKEVPEIIRNLARLVKHPSMWAPEEPGMPFGKANAECLAEALDILKGYGMEVKNLDNYAGYGQIGKGDTLIGVVGHLDVVPVSDGWQTDPFTLTEKDGNLYGRGSTDDKGPVACAIAALRIVNELRPDLNKRVRVVMGCNEESGSRCLAHYVEKEGDFDMGFTPDANFPCIHGEKGMIAGHFETPSEAILDVTGGDASNVVCGRVTFTLKPGTFDMGKLGIAFNARNIRFETNGTDPIHLTVYGVKAHASLPDLGINAIGEAFAALEEAGMKDPAVRFYNRYFGNTCHGERMGIDQQDAYGDLTLNVGLISMKDNIITGTIDIRFPVTKNKDQMVREYNRAAEGDEDGTIFMDHAIEPLFFPPDGAMLEAMVSAYREVSGDYISKPLVIGGGTYAKGIKNTIAFGPEFPDDPDIHMHGDDEFIPIANLAKQTEIYVKALLNLIDL